MLLCCCFMAIVNNYGHVGTVSLPTHFLVAGLDPLSGQPVLGANTFVG